MAVPDQKIADRFISAAAKGDVCSITSILHTIENVREALAVPPHLREVERMIPSSWHETFKKALVSAKNEATIQYLTTMIPQRFAVNWAYELSRPDIIAARGFATCNLMQKMKASIVARDSKRLKFWVRVWKLMRRSVSIHYDPDLVRLAVRSDNFDLVEFLAGQIVDLPSMDRIIQLIRELIPLAYKNENVKMAKLLIEKYGADDTMDESLNSVCQDALTKHKINWIECFYVTGCYQKMRIFLHDILFDVSSGVPGALDALVTGPFKTHVVQKIGEVHKDLFPAIRAETIVNLATPELTEYLILAVLYAMDVNNRRLCTSLLAKCYREGSDGRSDIRGHIFIRRNLLLIRAIQQENLQLCQKIVKYRLYSSEMVSPGNIVDRYFENGLGTASEGSIVPADYDNSVFGVPAYRCGAEDRLSPLVVAMRRKLFDIVMLLIKNGMTYGVDYDGNVALMLAIKWENLQVCQALISKGAVLASNFANEKPFQIAARIPNREILRLLIKTYGCVAARNEGVYLPKKQRRVHWSR